MSLALDDLKQLAYRLVLALVLLFLTVSTRHFQLQVVELLLNVQVVPVDFPETVVFLFHPPVAAKFLEVGNIPELYNLFLHKYSIKLNKMKTIIITLLTIIHLQWSSGKYIKARFAHNAKARSGQVADKLDRQQRLRRVQQYKRLKKEEEQKKVLRVHVFPHSHQDLAWLNSFDSNYHKLAKKVLNSVVDSLWQHPERTFLLSESGFMQRYVEDLSNGDSVEKLKSLVKKKQIEIVNGGYAANDHATTYYEDIIDQMTYGHQFVKNTFGVTVSTGWNVDTFGGSIVDNYLEEQMGITNVFLSRINALEKEQRMKENSMQMIMDTDHLPHLHASSFLQLKNVLLTMSSLHYSFQHEFCIDSTCKSSWRQSDTITQKNVREKAEKFKELIDGARQAYKNKEVIFLMLGDDFAYQESSPTFQQFELLMSEVNRRKEHFEMEVFWSTPCQYFQELKDSNRQAPPENQVQDIKKDDFFPYMDNPGQYWTGFYTSRPGLKYKVRDYGRYLQTTRTLFGLHFWKGEVQSAAQSAVDQLEQAMALMQHHDAVTGTSVQNVQISYRKALNEGVDAVQQVFLQMLNSQVRSVFSVPDSDILVYNCDHQENYYLECPDVFKAMQNKTPLLLSLYNPLGDRQVIIRMKVPRVHLLLRDIRQKESLLSDIFCQVVSDDFCEVYASVFLPKLAYTFLQVDYQQGKDFVVKHSTMNHKQMKKIYYNNGESQLQVQLNEGAMHLIIEQAYKEREELLISYKQLENSNGGAYVFTQGENELRIQSIFTKYQVMKGQLVTLIKAEDSHIQCLVKYYPNTSNLPSHWEKEALEINTLLLSSPEDRELFLRLQSKSITQMDSFETDANGLSLVRRKIGFHPSYPDVTSLCLGSQLYPMTKMARLRDTTTLHEMVVVSDRSQGVTLSQQDSAMDILIQRQMSSDDHKGMDQGIREQEMLLIKHWVVLGVDDQEQNARKVQLNTDAVPLIAQVQIPDYVIKNYKDEETYLGNQFQIPSPLVRLSLLYDLQMDYLLGDIVMRLQSFDLKEPQRVRVADIDHAFEKSLSNMRDKSEVHLMSQSLDWITEKKVFEPCLFMKALSLEAVLPPGMEVHTFQVKKRA